MAGTIHHVILLADAHARYKRRSRADWLPVGDNFMGWGWRMSTRSSGSSSLRITNVFASWLSTDAAAMSPPLLLNEYDSPYFAISSENIFIRDMTAGAMHNPGFVSNASSAPWLAFIDRETRRWNLVTSPIRYDVCSVEVFCSSRKEACSVPYTARRRTGSSRSSKGIKGSSRAPSTPRSSRR
jgi:hypothetical protein